MTGPDLATDDPKPRTPRFETALRSQSEEPATLGLDPEAPRVVILRDAVVVPRLGIIDRNRCVVEASRLRRQSSTPLKSKLYAAPIEAEATLPGRHVYAGFKINHFGHFLLESLARSWAIGPQPESLLWIPLYEVRPWHGYQRQLMTLAIGAGATNTVLERPTRVEELVVPDPGFIIKSHYTEVLKDHLARCESAAEAAEHGPKLWLSRSRISLSQGGWINEVDVEDALEQRGWTIYHPQEHPLGDQLAMLSRASVIAGTEGSAFHLLMFFKRLTAKVVIFSRIERINRNYRIIADRHGFAQEEVITPLIPAAVRERDKIFARKYFCDARFVVSHLETGRGEMAPRFKHTFSRL